MDTFLADLTFVGPYIVIYFYSKTNQMHNISNLIYFGTKLQVSDGLSVHYQESETTYSIRYMSYRFFGGLLASSQQNLYDICLMLYVQS
jgi:hypothetical protein